MSMREFIPPGPGPEKAPGFAARTISSGSLTRSMRIPSNTPPEGVALEGLDCNLACDSGLAAWLHENGSLLPLFSGFTAPARISGVDRTEIHIFGLLRGCLCCRRRGLGSHTLRGLLPSDTYSVSSLIESLFMARLVRILPVALQRPMHRTRSIPGSGAQEGQWHSPPRSNWRIPPPAPHPAVRC